MNWAERAGSFILATTLISSCAQSDASNSSGFQSPETGRAPAGQTRIETSRPTEHNIDPEIVGRTFAETALKGDFDVMLNLMVPDTRRTYLSMFTSRQYLEQFLGTYNCSTGKLTSNPAIIRFDQYSVEHVWNATYRISGQCQRKVHPDLPPANVQEITVVLEKVLEGGKERYYPKRTL